MRYVVIMAGGSGTRLWPLSRKGTPKQLLQLVDDKSLLRLSYERAVLVVPPENVVVVTGAAYVDAVVAEIPELPRENILGEPVGRDSLNACAWPAAVLQRRDPEAVVAQVTADHLIEPVDAFAEALTAAFEVAEADPDALVTLGVVPTSPHTGYGYLHRGDPVAGRPDAFEVVNFKEKPSLATAAMYVASGDYWWNAGMFVWRAATFLRLLSELEPASFDAVRAMAADPGLVADLFPTLRKDSVDYAIMEPAASGRVRAHVVAVALPVSWRDIGGYASLGDLLASDEAANAFNTPIATLDAANNIVLNRRGSGRLVALLGVNDLVVVETPDATLIVHRDQAEKVKELVAKIADSYPTFA